MTENNTESLINLANARNDQQRDVMETIRDDGLCPFCPEHLEMYHKEPILRTGEHWILTPNQWPYDNTRTHLLAIANYHTETLSGLRDGAFEELREHFVWAEAEFKIAAGGIAMRFGDTRKSGATVAHLHAHLIEPLPNLSKEDKVRFKIS